MLKLNAYARGEKLSSSRKAHRDGEGRARRFAAAHGGLERRALRGGDGRLVEPVAEPLNHAHRDHTPGFVDRELDANFAFDAGFARAIRVRGLRYVERLRFRHRLVARV